MFGAVFTKLGTAQVITQALAAIPLPDFGKLIVIKHDQGYITVYAHNRDILVKEQQNVTRGQKIAEVGSTGRSTGPHLHFEVRFKGAAQNPNRFLQNAQQQKLASYRRK